MFGPGDRAVTSGLAVRACVMAWNRLMRSVLATCVSAHAGTASGRTASQTSADTTTMIAASQRQEGPGKVSRQNARR
jgi:hypothetical protein